MNKKLVVSPHPDDAELGIGALIHKWTAYDYEVTIAVCTGPGNLAMYNSHKIVTFQERQEEQLQAAKDLGARVSFLDLAPASKFDTVPIVNFVTAFDSLYNAYDEVYIPMLSYARDHNIVWESSIATLRFGVYRGNMYAYEQCLQGNTPLYGGQVFGKKYEEVFDANVKAKVQAIARHSSQIIGRNKSPIDPDMIEFAARFRGSEVGVKYAELVYVLREIA